MTWLEILLNAWICDGCQIEVISQDDGLPGGWTLDVNGDLHLCPLCTARTGAALVEKAVAS